MAPKVLSSAARGTPAATETMANITAAKSLADVRMVSGPIFTREKASVPVMMGPRMAFLGPGFSPERFLPFPD